MRYTADLAHAEARCLNAARTGCPLAQFAAHNARARALCAARAAHLEAERLADPIEFAARLHDDALAADAYYYPQS